MKKYKVKKFIEKLLLFTLSINLVVWILEIILKVELLNSIWKYYLWAIFLGLICIYPFKKRHLLLRFFCVFIIIASLIYGEFDCSGFQNYIKSPLNTHEVVLQEYSSDDIGSLEFYEKKWCIFKKKLPEKIVVHASNPVMTIEMKKRDGYIFQGKEVYSEGDMIFKWLGEDILEATYIGEKTRHIKLLKSDITKVIIDLSKH